MPGEFFQSKIFSVLMIGLIIFLAFSLFKIRPEKVVVEKKIKTLQEKIAELDRSNNELGRLLDYFKSDAYLEREAKIKLNVRRPDERVVFVQPASPAAGEAISIEHDGLWSRLRALILFPLNKILKKN